MREKHVGYRGRALKLIKMAKAQIGDVVRVSKNGETYEGTLIPRSAFYGEAHLVIKLISGYNIGININEETKLEKAGAGAKPAFSRLPLPPQRTDLPKVSILSTGGTIASRVDYRTGGVRPALSASDLYSVVPELGEIAIIEAEILFSKFSENIAPNHWSQIAKSVASKIEKGTAGVVVAHGTDTMGYTAAALSFALQSLPVPVVLVGSQRSADRPSSDAATNLVGGVSAAATAPFAEIVVAMHENVSDRTIVFHRGTKARKCHTSRRDAFKSVNVLPLAKFEDNQIKMLSQNFRRRNPKRKLVVKPAFNERVGLVKFHPGLDKKAIDWYVNNGFKGIILEGTGLGHISSGCFSAIEKATANNIVVAMTSQCVWGRINMNVYDTGRDLLEIGVVPLGDMLSETALTKMMWATGQTKDVQQVKNLLAKNIAYETSDRTIFEEN